MGEFTQLKRSKSLMKNRSNPLCVVLAMATLLSITGFAASAAPPMIAAVLPFAAQNPDQSALAQNFTALLEANLSTAQDVQLVERSDIDKIQKEIEATLAGTVSSAGAAQIGQLTGAGIIITGRLIPRQ